MNYLKRLHYTFLKSHTHVKPALGGDEYDGWQVVNANVLISFVDDLFVYGIGVAVGNFRAGVRQLWRASEGKGGDGERG